MGDIVDRLVFKNGVAKIANPIAGQMVKNIDKVYANAQCDYVLFKLVSKDYKTLNSNGYMTVRDTQCLLFYVQTDVVWVFKPNQRVKYILKILEVHWFILFVQYSLYTFSVITIFLLFFGLFCF